MSLDALRSKPGRQPEAVVSSFERHSGTCDPVAFLFGLRPPAAQQVQQCAFVDRQLLQWLALDARNKACDKPARLAHFNHSDQRRVHIQRVETPAEIVHGAPSGCAQCSDGYVSPLPPHSILTAASTTADWRASGLVAKRNSYSIGDR